MPSPANLRKHCPRFVVPSIWHSQLFSSIGMVDIEFFNTPIWFGNCSCIHCTPYALCMVLCLALKYLNTIKYPSVCDTMCTHSIRLAVSYVHICTAQSRALMWYYPGETWYYLSLAETWYYPKCILHSPLQYPRFLGAQPNAVWQIALLPCKLS